MTSDPDRRRRFETLAHDVFEPLQRYLRRRASAADADDVLADALLVIWRRLDDVPDAAPLPWCYGVARRCLANHRRGRDRHLQLVDRVAAEPPRRPSGDQLDPQLAVERADPTLHAAIERLTHSEAEIVRLWAWEQLEAREIATVLDLTANAVSVALSRARRKLREELVTSDSHRQDLDPSGQRPGVDAIEQEGSER